MTSFRYKAMTQKGTIVRGVLEASSEAAVVAQLRGLGHFPISAAAAQTAALAARIATFWSGAKKPSLAALCTATIELAALLQAGLELDRALGILCRLSDIGALQAPFERVRGRVRDGSS